MLDSLIFSLNSTMPLFFLMLLGCLLHRRQFLTNDFVAMVKDSSLVSVLGVADVTQLAKVTAAGHFRSFETYNIAALIYLTLTIGLSLILRRIEMSLRKPER